MENDQDLVFQAHFKKGQKQNEIKFVYAFQFCF